ncbi:ABC transporter ATP-binding protein [Aeribacillus alveayuensis]|uniref:ABC transport system ATP-binding protein n=1 Tax=Aeribacillus alveayuensis TaxID=279215 RepID=A0ABT9VT57_9BACI|nr:putative ABC transport system ATP-binding protein [Bacillus alveayuensis]
MIQLNSVYKSLKNGQEQLRILEDINLTIEKGEFVSIMGPSGSGKSTLMNILGLLDKPSLGQYILDGEDTSQLNQTIQSQLRNNLIGFVFQQFHLFPRLTAIKNVELPLIYSNLPKKERIVRATIALKKVGLSERMDYLPNQLSGGQKQRVAIARALVNKPKIILADEPTGALDTKTGAQIMDLFLELNKEGVTVIVITHEKDVAAYANRVINIRDGRIIQDRRI